MGTKDLLMLGGLAAAGGYFLLTRDGRRTLEDLTGIEIPIDFDLFDLLNLDGLYDIIGYGEGAEPLPEYEDNTYGDSTRGKYGADSDELYIKERYTTPMSDNRSLDRNYRSPDYYYPIQDLFVPANYNTFRYKLDPALLRSPEWIDWYLKTSGLKLDDLFFPEHHYWNPDYYYHYGNLQKMWYPNIYDISHKPERRMPYWFGEVYY